MGLIRQKLLKRWGWKMYDLVIIGAGPAGITASIYAARKKMDFLVIARDIGGQAVLSYDIENYTGYQFITGPELAERFRQHIHSFNIQVREGEEVKLLQRREDKVIKITTDRAEYEAKTAIIASGRIPRKLKVAGETEFKNRGVTYCATCDGPLFAGKDVCVVGGGNSALDAVLQLMKIARKIYLVDKEESLRADPVMVEKARSSPLVTIYNNSTVKEIFGEKLVKGIKISQKEKEITLPVAGIFIEIGSVPSADFVPDVQKNNAGEIIVNCRCETNLAGIFAAGDVTDVPAKQIIVACGEGAKAALSAFQYLSKQK